MAKALEVFQEMKANASCQPDLITYSTLIKGFCRDRRIEEALKLFKEMEENTGIVPDEVLYNSLLDGCCKANHLDLALKAYSNMKFLKIRPSNVTYSILV